MSHNNMTSWRGQFISNSIRGQDSIHDHPHDLHEYQFERAPWAAEVRLPQRRPPIPSEDVEMTGTDSNASDAETEIVHMAENQEDEDEEMHDAGQDDLEDDMEENAGECANNDTTDNRNDEGMDGSGEMSDATEDEQLESNSGQFRVLRVLAWHSNNSMLFTDTLNATQRHTATSLQSIFPGILWAIVRIFSDSARQAPLNLGALDYIVECSGQSGENFFWEDAIDDEIARRGPEQVRDMIFLNPLQVPIQDSEEEGFDDDPSEICPQHGNSAFSSETFHGRARLPIWGRGPRDLYHLRFIEQTHVLHSVTASRDVLFNHTFDTNETIPARDLVRSFPGLDIVIREIFGNGNTSRPINLEYLDYVAGWIAHCREEREYDIVSTEDWLCAFEDAIMDIGKEDVDGELFKDWTESLPPNLSPTEQQLLHLIDSDNGETAESAIALFKSMYADSRENEWRQEVREASESFRAVVQRMKEHSDFSTAPPIYFPQTLQIYEDANEAGRKEVEERAIAERERLRLPPRCCDEDGEDDFGVLPDNYTLADDLRNLRVEEIRRQPPMVRFINAWFFCMTERLLANDVSEEQWHWWDRIQPRLRSISPDEMYQLAYLNVFEGMGVERLLIRAECRDRSFLPNLSSRQTTESLDAEEIQREVNEWSIQERRLYFERESDRIAQRLWAEFSRYLGRVPVPIRLQINEQQDDWMRARLESWDNGAGGEETPAQNLVRQAYAVEIHAREMSGERPSPIAEMEIEAARRFDNWTHHRSRTADALRRIQEMEAAGQDFTITVQVPQG